MGPRSSCRFGALQIAYDERVLTPRSWTEMQSNWAAELSPSLPDGPILELCAGAGQIGLLAAALTGRQLVQVDVDRNAAAFACENARAAGLTARHEFRVAPIADALAPHEQFPLILADPPYIPSDDVASWPEDPVLAIDGGDDGLEVINACLAAIAGHLAADGVALLQVRGASQADEVAGRSEAAFSLRASDIRSVDDERAVMKLENAVKTAGNGYSSPAFRREGSAR